MSRRLWLGLLLALLMGASPAHAISVDEIILLCKTGVSADIVIQNIRSDSSRPKIGPADVERLRRGAVPERVISFLLKGHDPGSRRPTHVTKDHRRQNQLHRQQAAARRRDEDLRLEAERLRLEAERLKQEAQRLARDANAARARASALEGRVKAMLEQAFSDLRRGREWRAIRGFYRFLHSGLVQPNSYAYLEGAYGLGRAFLAVNMYQSATGYLVEVIRRGPTTPRFDSAVTLLQKVVDRLDFVHPIIALLAAFEQELKTRPRAWLDAYHFFLGEFYERYDNAKKALHHFGHVSSSSRRYAAARYHQGLIYTGQKKPRTGVRYFRESLSAAKAARNRPVQNLASQALARLAFEVGSFKAAEHFYRRVSRRSQSFGRAQYELAWTLVMSERYSRALGTIHGLHSPFFAREYFPDLLILEAATYLNICRHKEAQQTLKRFNRRFGPLMARIRSYLAARPNEQTLYRDVRRLANRGSTLPKAVLHALVADVGFFRTLKTARLLEAERTLASRRLQGKVRSAVVGDLTKRHSIYLTRVGLEIRRRLRDILVELDGVKVKADEIGLEVELAEKGQLEADRRKLASGRSVKSRLRGTRTRRLRLRKGQQLWPFEGEYWLDEIGAYRSRLRGACPLRRGR